MTLKLTLLPLLAITATLAFTTPAQAAAAPFSCEASDSDNWASIAELKEKVAYDGFGYHRHKPDGGCYEVHIVYADGRIAEAYYHPVSLELEFVRHRGEVMYERSAMETAE